MADEKKICPLFLASDQFSEAKYCECREEKCAWWDENRQKCAVAIPPPRR